MTPFVVALMLFAAETPAAETPAATTTAGETPAATTLLVLDVTVASPDDIDKGAAETLAQLLAARAARFPIKVMSQADIRDLVELEGDKQAAGCDQSSASCLGEIAGALGADLVLATRAGKLDAVFVVSVQLFDAKNASAEGRASVEAWSLAEASAKLAPLVDDLIAKATGTSPVDTPKHAATAAPPVAIDDGMRFGLQVGGGSAVAVGGIVTVLGAVPALVYGSTKSELIDRTRNFDPSAASAADDVAAAQQLHDRAVNQKELYNGVGRWLVVTGVVVAVLGGAALAGGFLLPAPQGAGE